MVQAMIEARGEKNVKNDFGGFGIQRYLSKRPKTNIHYVQCI